MISISFCLLTVFVFIDSAVCDTTGDKLRESKSDDTGYPYNHPPSVEYYNPIPVSIVYEDTNDFSGKSGTKSIPDASEENEKIKRDEKVQTTSKDEIQTTTEANIKTTGTTPKITKKNDTEPEQITRSRALKEYQIPVAVVYDSEPVNNNYQRTKTETKPEIIKPRSSYAQKKNIKTGTNQNAQTPEIGDAKSILNDNIKTFKKRARGPEPVIPIIDMESYVFSHNGNFRYSYEGGDGTKAFSEGKQINVNDRAGESVVGGFSYKDKDGKDFSLTYTADENGYRPVGAHLPTPPPIPPAIARALAYLATATTPEPVTKAPRKL